MTLPASTTIGQTFVVNKLTAGNTVTISGSGSQQIIFGTSITTISTGSLVLDDIGDSLRIVYAGSDLFFVEYSIGNINVN